MGKKIIVSVKNLVKTYDSGKVKTYAVRGLSFDIFEGEFVALSGPSGSGKSTTLYQLGLLDKPTKGSIIIEEKNVLELTNIERTNFRLKKLGYVFQRYELIPELTALENVFLPLKISMEKKDYAKKANEVLDNLGLKDRKSHYPNELSGGEQQRVSIARALAGDPKIIFADEPTANLDSVRGKEIMEILKYLCKKLGKTVLVVNHEKMFEKYFDRIIRIKDGQLDEIENVKGKIKGYSSVDEKRFDKCFCSDKAFKGDK